MLSKAKRSAFFLPTYRDSNHMNERLKNSLAREKGVGSPAATAKKMGCSKVIVTSLTNCICEISDINILF